MTNVINVKFPKIINRKIPKRRVFFLGYYYAGPPLCQSLEKLWLKRKPNNYWVLQQKIDGRVFECEKYHGNDLLEALERIPFADVVTIDDLLGMGWFHKGHIKAFPRSK